jgi:hypothetical protein
MTKVITLTDIRIGSWRVDVLLKRVAVDYSILEDTGETFSKGIAIFWEVIPEPTTDPDGNTVPNPDNWYQLPPEHVAHLTALTVDARAALLHLINE